MINTLYKVPLGFLVHAQKGVKPIVVDSQPFNESVPYLDINALEEGVITQHAHQEVSDLTYEGEILVVWDGSRSGLVFKSRYGAVGSTLMRLKPILVLQDYLYYFIKSQFDFINGNTSGASIPHVDADLFFNIEIPFGDITVQQNIIDNIEKKYSQNSNLLAQQKDVINQILSTANIDFNSDDDIEKSIRKFRQAVIEKAISGELTREWRASNSSLSWKKTTLDQLLIDKPKNGYSPRPVNYPTNFKVLTLSATTSGIFDAKHFKYFDEKIDPESDLWLKNGDILVQRGNSMEYVGVPAMYTAEDNEYIYPDLMIRIRPSNEVHKEFLLLFLSSESSRNFLREKATGSSGSMPKINQKTLLELPVNLPPITEQRYIVDLIHELLEISDRVLHQYSEAVDYFNSLNKSIISEAFRFENLESYTTNENFEIIYKEILLQRRAIEKEQLILKKKRSDFVNKTFLKSSEYDKIKSKIKELTLDEYINHEYISPLDLSNLRKKISDMVKDFDYDDFLTIFQDLVNEKLSEVGQEPFFIAVELDGVLHYKINKS